MHNRPTLHAEQSTGYYDVTDVEVAYGSAGGGHVHANGRAGPGAAMSGEEGPEI